MSAFIIDPETMDRVVSTLLATSKWGERAVSYSTLGLFGYEYDPHWEVGTKLGQRLYEDNLTAVGKRYPHFTEEETREAFQHYDPAHSYEYRSEPHDLANKAQMIAGYKALCCLIYQCSEGNPESRETYNMLLQVRTMIAHLIIADTPEYKAAPWG